MKKYLISKDKKKSAIHLKLNDKIKNTQKSLFNHIQNIKGDRNDIEIEHIWTDIHNRNPNKIAPIAMLVMKSSKDVDTMLELINNWTNRMIIDKATKFGSY
jgi:hypothetical protein